MRRVPAFAIMLCAGLLMAGPAAAHDFFEALYDVPVMPGLSEVPGQAVLFDKPDGRIASVTAVSRALQPGQIASFYAESLPQLGWRKSAQNQYVRGGDRLTIELSRTAPVTVAQFTLSPAPQAGPRP